MNTNHRQDLAGPALRQAHSKNGAPPTQEELRVLAKEIVTHCPSLAQLLLALGSVKRFTGPN